MSDTPKSSQQCDFELTVVEHCLSEPHLLMLTDKKQIFYLTHILLKC